MDALKGLRKAHNAAAKLENETKKYRINLIKEYKNRNSSNSNWYILKTGYSAFAEQLRKETAKFDKLLQEESDKIDIDDSNHSEIIDNMCSDSASSSGSDKGLEIDTSYDNTVSAESVQIKMEDDEKKEISEKEPIITADIGKGSELELYEDSVPVTDNLSVDETQIKIECEQKKEIPEKEKVIVSDAGSELELYKDSVPMTENLSVDQAQIELEPEQKQEISGKKVTNPGKVKKVSTKSSKNCKSNAEYPVLAKGKINNGKKNQKINYVKGRTCKVRSGYKYQGKGFEVFTGYRNKSQPIYSSTMLYCQETCNQNEEELIKYLVENGKFKKAMIEEVVFKANYYNHYALIKVRAPLKIIKKKIKTLNKYDRYNTNRYETMKIFKRSGYISANDMANANNVLYVNNFDILKGNTHKMFTNLFLRFGELVKDIKMGLDRNRDPYAIIHFRDLQDAKKCFAAKDLSFGGKILSIRFSKF